MKKRNSDRSPAVEPIAVLYLDEEMKQAWDQLLSTQFVKHALAGVPKSGDIFHIYSQRQITAADVDPRILDVLVKQQCARRSDNPLTQGEDEWDVVIPGQVSSVSTKQMQAHMQRNHTQHGAPEEVVELPSQKAITAYRCLCEYMDADGFVLAAERIPGFDTTDATILVRNGLAKKVPDDSGDWVVIRRVQVVVEGSQPKTRTPALTQTSEPQQRRPNMATSQGIVTMTPAEQRFYSALMEHATGHPDGEGWRVLDQSPGKLCNNATMVSKFKNQLKITKGSYGGPFHVKVVEVVVAGGKGIKPKLATGTQPKAKPAKRAKGPKVPKPNRPERTGKKKTRRGAKIKLPRAADSLGAPPTAESASIQGPSLREQVVEFLTRNPGTNHYRSVDDLDAIADMLVSMRSALLSIRNAVEPRSAPEPVAVAESSVGRDLATES
ncbi:MAG: hypothetical protein WAP74_01385 [Patescibacteria group bacterium]